jgi:hypothetical protein
MVFDRWLQSRPIKDVPLPGDEIVRHKPKRTVPYDSEVWDREYGDDGLPIHLAMPVNAKGEGPVRPTSKKFVGWLCWCGVKTCDKFLRNIDYKS